VSLQVAAAEEAEAERIAAAEYKTAVNQYSELVASGNALVKDLRASLVVGTGLVDQAAIDEATRLVEYLDLTLAASKSSESTADVQDEIAAIEAAIAEAQASLEDIASLAASAGEARLAAATLAGEQIRQKVAAALASLAAAADRGAGTADAMAALAAALKSAEASHQTAVLAQEAENKPDSEAKPPAKPQPDSEAKPPAKPQPEKDEPVDKTGWYTHEEASQAIVSAWSAVPWYDGCTKVGDGYWYRSGGSPSSPPAPPAVTNVLGFKVEIINAEKAWAYYYDCP
jgi:CO dehydrogenase/acetyl-CoA synthase epsilon subunit